jgi:hypothetical protein
MASPRGFEPPTSGLGSRGSTRYSAAEVLFYNTFPSVTGLVYTPVYTFRSMLEYCSC